MELVWASDDFVICGQPYSGFPILLWDSMDSCAPVNQFFRCFLLRGAIGSKKSWESAGRALYDFFSFLQAHSLGWGDVDRGEAKSLLAAYRDYCRHTFKLSIPTVRQRMHYICMFYKYALSKRWVRQLPFDHEERTVRRESGFLAHVDASGGKAIANSLMPRLQKTLPKFLNMADVRALLAAADNPHHRIMIRLALYTGMRREEIASFPLAYVFDPIKSGRSERNIRIHLNPLDGEGILTKGNKPRDIFISSQFMAELHRYVSKVRGERASLNITSCKTLLINQLGQPFKSGGKSLNDIIKAAGQRAGISVHMHMLRHTYATQTLVSLQRSRSAGLDPLVFIQRQLGHSSIQTTMVYLHLINEIADEAVLAYDDELNDLAGGI